MPRKALVKIKPRRYKKGDIVTVATVIMHPMETGMRKDKKTGKVIPAHYITDVEVYYAGEKVTYMKTTSGLSANPFIAFNIKVDKEAPLKIVWKDNTGDVTEKVVKIKFAQ
ncbi:MAG: thiosulfate oxidation carrier complex protein SoxZ [Aquificae bacterium]|nr:thiosulfate oxidation carrier complex protein SoxZ [Aquificota bacterium]